MPLRLLAMDVDGVLTDGRITWGVSMDGALHEMKSFDVKDGLGISLALAAGLQIAWITGRQSPLVERRAQELGVTHLCQGARDKRAVLGVLIQRLGLSSEQVLYIGDDLNDLPAFAAAGTRVAVADAVDALKSAADWVTAAAGGRGAVREVIDGVLSAQGLAEEAVRLFLERLEGEQQSAPAAAAEETPGQ
jgi:3-deoxy-D-manno-octulosonate 8-phosphate phosphatase (KDO 8-P phosphatase)